MDRYLSDSGYTSPRTSLPSPFAVELDYHIVLQVENPTGSNNWINAPGGITRETGESAHYRISYSFSATEPGEFNNMVIQVNFHEEFENITNINNVALPSGATFFSSLTNGGYFLQINLGSGIPPGQSVIIEFTAISNTKTGGPDGYLITTDVSLSGEFFDQLDGSTTPLVLTEPGPTWTVKAENKHNYTKVVSSNGDISVPDDEAYLVTFTITDSYREGDYTQEGIGGWSNVGTRTIDTIPTIPGVVPEVVWSNIEPYTVSGNQVTWDIRPPTDYLSNPGDLQYNLQLRVRYPKAQVDAAGGLAAMTNLTNHVDVEFVLVGGIVDVKSAEVTFDLLPVPAPIYGNDISYKYAITFGRPYSGTALYYGDNFLTWEYSGQLSGSNVLLEEQIITEGIITFETTTGEIYAPGYDEMQWTELRVVANSGYAEYQTNVGGDTWYPFLTLQIPPPSQEYFEPFPELADGVYVSKWRVVGTGFVNINERLYVNAISKFLQRTEAQPLLYKIHDTMDYTAVFYDGTTISNEHSAFVDVEYTNLIELRNSYLVVVQESVAPGGLVEVIVDPTVIESTTVVVEGSSLYGIIPSGLIFQSVEMFNENAEFTYSYTENWNGSGDSLIQVNYIAPVATPLIFTIYSTLFKFQVDSTSTASDYAVEFYYALNPAQANNPAIRHIASGTTAPDIYDFDQDGDRAEQMPHCVGNVHVITASIVNVLKMSKSSHDPSFQINNDTQITNDELFQYRIFVRNDSAYPMTNITMIDVFPFVGDVFESQWAPVFVEATSPSDGISFLYSLSTDPDFRPIEEKGSGVWLENPPEDFSLVKAVKVDFGGKIFALGEYAEIFMQMRAPEGVLDESRSYNSINYIASAIIDGNVAPYQPAFSPPAYARLTYRAFDTSLGDFVWYDLNGNGIQDPGETGINGVTVSIFDDRDQLVYQTITADHPITGQPGYYLFSGIWEEEFYAAFPTTLAMDGNTYVLTTRMQGNDRNLDSDPNPETGFTNLIQISEGEHNLSVDAGYVIRENGNASIGDFVWSDLNGNGIQDPGNPGEPGLNSVPVYLLNGEGELLASTETINSPITGEPGYYMFAGLFPGIYQVSFPTSLPGGIVLTLQSQGSDPEKSSAPNPITGLTEVFTLGSGEVRLDMDAGYRVPPEPNQGVIGDYVWLDLNKNGIQDFGEPGIDDVMVQLYDSNNTLIASMITVTDPSAGNLGHYSFRNLAADTYRVSFPPVLPNGSTLVEPFAGSDDQINSKPNPLTGFTEDIVLMPGESRTNIDAGYNPPALPPVGIITKTANKHVVITGEEILFTITFVNNSADTIVGLRIFDIPDNGYFEYTDAVCRVDAVEAPLTMDIDGIHIIFVVQEPIPINALVTIEVRAFARPGTPAGSYYDYAYAEYGDAVTDQTPDVEIIIQHCKPCPPNCCRPCKCAFCTRCRCR